MKWFEPIIVILATLMVILPFAFEIKNAISKKGHCSCGCTECNKKDKCLVNFQKFIKENKTSVR